MFSAAKQRIFNRNSPVDAFVTLCVTTSIGAAAGWMIGTAHELSTKDQEIKKLIATNETLYRQLKATVDERDKLHFSNLKK